MNGPLGVNEFAQTGQTVAKNLLSLGTVLKLRKSCWTYYCAYWKSRLEFEGEAITAMQVIYPLADAPEELGVVFNSSKFQRKVIELTGWEQFFLFDYFLFVKPPGSERTPWHRDGDSLPFNGETLTVWIPLTPLKEGLSYAIGSGQITSEIPDFDDDQQFMCYISTKNMPIKTNFDLKLGDAQFHDKYIWHSGPANVLDYPRLAVSLGLVSGDAIVTVDPPGFKKINLQKQMRKEKILKNFLKSAAEGSRVSDVKNCHK